MGFCLKVINNNILCVVDSTDELMASLNTTRLSYNNSSLQSAVNIIL